MADLPNEMIEKIYEAVELARSTGTIRKGTNEVTKAIEKGDAKLVIYAENTNPKEVIMHIPLIAKEKGILCVAVPSREELGTAAGLPVSSASVAIVKEGESKKILKELKEVLDEIPAQKEAKEPKAEAKEPKTKAKETKTEVKETETEAKEPKAEAKETEAEAKEPKAEAKEPKAEVKETKTKAKETETEVKETETKAKEPKAEVKEESPKKIEE